MTGNSDLSSVKPRAAGVKRQVTSHRSGTGQELLHLAEESRRFRMRLLGRQSLELVEQFTLPLGQFLRRLDQNLNVHVAGLFRAQHRHSFTLEAEAAARLRPLRHFHPGIAAVDGRHLEFAPQCRLDHGDGHAAMHICAFALEERMRSEGEKKIKVARRTAADAGLAFAGEPDAGAVLDAGRNVHGQRALARHAPRAGAGRAGIADHLAAALAVRAGALQREEALRVQDASLAAAARTGLRPGAGLRARARAGLAGDRGRDAHLRGLAGIGLFQADLHVVAQVGAALAPAAAPAPAAAHAEEIVENVGEGRGHVAEAAAGARPGTVLERGVTEAVIGRALVGVLEHFIGFVDFLEAGLGALVAGVAVGMPFHRQLAERGFQLAIGRRAFDLEDFVVAALRHARVPPRHFFRSVVAESYLVTHGASKKMHPRGWPRGCGLESTAASRPLSLRQADFLFFLSSSTSVNSASTTSSFLPPGPWPPAAPPGPPGPPGPPAAASSCACLYIASPSFIEACASALVLAVIASASVPFKASLRSASAFSIARRSPSPTLAPCSASAFSVVCTSASAWFLASTSALRFLSSSACDSASLTMRWMSASDRPPEAWMRICCSLPVPLSFAWTLTMPLASMSNVTSICGTPRGAGGSPTRSNWPSILLSAAISRSPWNTRMVTAP